MIAVMGRHYILQGNATVAMGECAMLDEFNGRSGGKKRHKAYSTEIIVAISLYY